MPGKIENELDINSAKVIKEPYKTYTLRRFINVQKLQNGIYHTE